MPAAAFLIGPGTDDGSGGGADNVPVSFKNLTPVLVLTSAALGASLGATSGCVAAGSMCQYDEECEGGAVCAFGTCASIACNVDDDCGGRVCSAGMCAPETPEPTPPAVRPPPTGACAGVLFEPSDGSADVSPLAEVRVTFATEADADAAMVTVEGPGEFRRLRDSATIGLVPLEALNGGSAYTVRAALPCGVVTATFSVAAINLTRSALNVATSIQSGDVLPVGARNLFALLELPALRLSVEDSGGLLGFENESGAQQPCEATIPLQTLASRASVWTARGEVDALSPTNVGIRELHVRAVETTGGAELAAYVEIDGRKIAHYVLNECREGSAIFPGCVQFACEIVKSNIPCEPCADGAPYCLHFSMRTVATRAEAPAPLTNADVCANPRCADQPECR